MRTIRYCTRRKSGPLRAEGMALVGRKRESVNGKRQLDKEYKLVLVSVLHSKIKYGNETSSMANIQDRFAMDVLKSMESGNYEAGKVTYAG